MPASASSVAGAVSSTSRVVVDGSCSDPINLSLSSVVATTAGHLHALCVLPGARVAAWRLPRAQALSLTFAVPTAGAVLVWFNDRWDAAETARALVDASPDVVLVGAAADWALVADCAPASVGVVCDADWRVIAGAPDDLAARTPPPEFADNTCWPWPREQLPYAVFYTSGTTGRPKGVVLSHAAMLAQARAKLAHVGFDEETRYLHLAPLYHLGGASSAVAVALAGGVHILGSEDNSMSTGASALMAISRNHVNTLVVVPAILQMMLDDAVAAGKNLTGPGKQGQQPVYAGSIDTILYGGGAITSGLRQAVVGTSLFGPVRLIGAYGMTEAASSMTFVDHSTLPSNSKKHSSVGRAPWHVELQVRHVKDVSVRVRGGWETGEIMTRGPHVMDGYLGRPHDTSAALSADGWLATGDLGYVDDDGDLHLVGRLKDMIKSGGECVFAGEVEAVLGKHPGVSWVAVVGVPHRVLGEAVAAAVVLTRDAGEVDPHSLDGWCRRRLSPYKRPRWFISLERCPSVGGTGKVRKVEVREAIERVLNKTGASNSAKL
jgi:acyl-CoA synthetase (AMP-forming)/AMP-acid ligase II